MPPRTTPRTALVLLVAAALSALALGGAAASTPGWQQPVKPGWKEGEAKNGWIVSTMAKMTLEEKVGQLFVTYAYGETADTTKPADVAANRQVHGVDNAAQLVEKYNLGGVIYFAWSNNVNNPRQIAGLSNGLQSVAMDQRLPIPLLISTDQEQGVVVRVGPPATQFPGNMALGATRSAAQAATAARITGKELRALGINQDYAPVADVNVNARNPVIGVRSFGEDPQLTSDLVAAQVHGFQEEADVAATAKHFPGHGDTTVDSHYGLPVITHTREELERIDLPPFEAAIERGIDSIMTAHIVVPALDDSGDPATLSRPIMTGLLRKRLGYDGVVVTDSLGMAGVREKYGDDRVPVLALKAGVDQLLMPPSIDLAYNAVLDAVRSGEIPERRIDESVYRVLRLKHYRGLFRDPYVDPDRIPAVVGTPQHLAAAEDVADRSVTLVRNDAELLPLASGAGRKVLVTGWGVSTTATLASAIAQRGDSATTYETGLNPSAATIEMAAARAEQSDLVVVTTNKAWTSTQQQALVRRLVETGTPVAVLAVRDPYDVAYLPTAPTYVATYSYAGPSLRAAVKVLYGEVDPAGRLPVTIPTADDSQAVLYPYGHGLGFGR